MDFVTRQFIGLAKKLRKDLGKALSDLRQAVQQQTEAIRKAGMGDHDQQKPEHPPLVLRAELHVPENIEKDRKTHENRQHRLQTWVVVGSWAAFLAASCYAYVAVRQWREMIAVRHQTQGAIDAANRTARAAEAANTQAREAVFVEERPWVGPSLVQHVKESSNMEFIGFKVFIENIGQTPALKITVMTAATILDKPLIDAKDFPDTFFKTIMLESEKQPHMVGHGALLPRGHGEIPEGKAHIAPQAAAQIRAKTKWFFVFGKITYEDTLKHPADSIHVTHFCTRLDADTFHWCNDYNDMN